MALFKRDLFEIGDEEPVGVASVWEQPLGDERREPAREEASSESAVAPLPSWRASGPRRGDRAYGAFGDRRAGDRCRCAADQPGGAGARHRLKRARSAECRPSTSRARAQGGAQARSRREPLAAVQRRQRRSHRRGGSGVNADRRTQLDERPSRGNGSSASQGTGGTPSSVLVSPLAGVGRGPRPGEFDFEVRYR